MNKRTLSIILVISLLFCSVPSFASQEKLVISNRITVQIPEEYNYDSDEMFSAYVENTFYEYDASVFSFNYGSGFTHDNGLADNFYFSAKTLIPQIAENGGSTIIKESYPNIRTDILNMTEDEAVEALMKEVEEQLYIDKFTTAILADFPYELYWFDKTSPIYYNVYMGYNGSYLEVTKVELLLPVSKAYQAENYDPLNPMVTSDVSKVKTALENAKKVVADNVMKPDFEKLTAYKDYICDAVSYNFDAAFGNAEYGDPWQLIWVFDNDPSTNVVCEGYAKAFAYICDISNFRAFDVSPRLMTGLLSDGTEAEGHMWNTITMNGNNYLVDLTNCDTGMVGENGELFLTASPDNTSENSYSFKIGTQDVIYSYDTETMGLYEEGELNLHENKGTVTLKWYSGYNYSDLLTGDEYPTSISIGDTLTSLPKPPAQDGKYFAGWRWRIGGTSPIKESSRFIDTETPILANIEFCAEYLNYELNLITPTRLNADANGVWTLPDNPTLNGYYLLNGYYDMYSEIFKEGTIGKSHQVNIFKPEYVLLDWKMFSIEGYEKMTDDNPFELPSEDSLLYTQGAQVRVQMNKNDPALGLRFINIVNTNMITAIKNIDGITNVHFGTFVAKADEIGDAELTEKSARTSNIRAKNIYRTPLELNGPCAKYTVCITGIPETDLKSKIAIRPYICYTDQSNVVRYIYGEQYSGVDLYSVAQMAYNSEKESSEVKEYLMQNILSKAN